MTVPWLEIKLVLRSSGAALVLDGICGSGQLPLCVVLSTACLSLQRWEETQRMESESWRSVGLLGTLLCFLLPVTPEGSLSQPSARVGLYD